MKYILRSDDGGFDLESYQAYLEGEGQQLARCIEGLDLLDIARFVPPSRGSFHDGRFVGLSFEFAGENSPRMEGRLRLKGPYFDRFFELDYVGLVSYRMDSFCEAADLLMHEVRAEGDDLVHEFVYDGGGFMEFRCALIRFREILTPAG